MNIQYYVHIPDLVTPWKAIGCKLYKNIIKVVTAMSVVALKDLLELCSVERREFEDNAARSFHALKRRGVGHHLPGHAAWAGAPLIPC
jgi:hypothetical protein